MENALQLDNGEWVKLDSDLYTSQWCDGISPGVCMCGGDNGPRGHWRGGRRIKLKELLRLVAKRQREACAEYLKHWTYDDHDLSRVRTTPLVTETKP